MAAASRQLTLMLDKSILNIASTLSILLPIWCNVIKVKEAGLLGRLFLLFLGAGLTTDLLMWYLHINPTEGLSRYLFSAYSLAEALFFFWLLRQIGQDTVMFRVAGYCMAVSPFVWFITLIASMSLPNHPARGITFDALYEVTASFLAGFTLLLLVERNVVLTRSWQFWFSLGIFFYCFCTFFVMTLLGTQLSLSLWPLNNVVNILTYLMYATGWYMYPRQGLSG